MLKWHVLHHKVHIEATMGIVAVYSEFDGLWAMGRDWVTWQGLPPGHSLAYWGGGGATPPRFPLAARRQRILNLLSILAPFVPYHCLMGSHGCRGRKVSASALS